MSALSTADRLAHEAASYVRPTTEVRRAVDRFRALSDSIDRATSRDSHYMTTSEVIALRDMQEERAQIYIQLEFAGQLHLVTS